MCICVSTEPAVALHTTIARFYCFLFWFIVSTDKSAISFTLFTVYYCHAYQSIARVSSTYNGTKLNGQTKWGISKTDFWAFFKSRLDLQTFWTLSTSRISLPSSFFSIVKIYSCFRQVIYSNRVTQSRLYLDSIQTILHADTHIRPIRITTDRVVGGCWRNQHDDLLINCIRTSTIAPSERKQSQIVEEKRGKGADDTALLSLLRCGIIAQFNRQLLCENTLTICKRRVRVEKISCFGRICEYNTTSDEIEARYRVQNIFSHLFLCFGIGFISDLMTLWEILSVRVCER